LSNQKKLRTEVIQLEDALSQVRKAYEMLRIEFEQTLAANEQTGETIAGRLFFKTKAAQSVKKLYFAFQWSVICKFCLMSNL